MRPDIGGIEGKYLHVKKMWEGVGGEEREKEGVGGRWSIRVNYVKKKKKRGGGRQREREKEGQSLYVKNGGGKGGRGRGERGCNYGGDRERERGKRGGGGDKEIKKVCVGGGMLQC